MPLSRTILSFFFPAGVIVIAVAMAVHAGLVPSSAVLEGLSVAAYVAAALLAWRFHSTRMMLAAVILAGAEAAVRLAGANAATVRDLAAILVPANIIALAFVPERGILSKTTAVIAGIMGAEVALASLLCRPEVDAAALLELGFLPVSLARQLAMPQIAMLVFVAGALFFLARFAMLKTPVESGLFWILAACFRGFSSSAAEPWAAAAGAVVCASIIENSYVMAFHDQLTGLPARRAFYRTASTLPAQYAIAVADVDHFKRFNDTYGHEVGDQVLRMVAARMARVTGGGKAFRWGGEEFVLVFPGRTPEDALEHLELLRQLVEASTFILRAPDRRKHSADDRGRAPQRAQEVWVTVSIGVAQGHEDLRKAMDEADGALYAAKAAGRNRVEVAVPVSPISARLPRTSAARN